MLTRRILLPLLVALVSVSLLPTTPSLAQYEFCAIGQDIGFSLPAKVTGDQFVIPADTSFEWRNPKGGNALLHRWSGFELRQTENRFGQRGILFVAQVTDAGKSHSPTTIRVHFQTETGELIESVSLAINKYITCDLSRGALLFMRGIDSSVLATTRRTRL